MHGEANMRKWERSKRGERRSTKWRVKRQSRTEHIKHWMHEAYTSYLCWLLRLSEWEILFACVQSINCATHISQWNCRKTKTINETECHAKLWQSIFIVRFWTFQCNLVVLYNVADVSVRWLFFTLSYPQSTKTTTLKYTHTQTAWMFAAIK